MSESSTGREPCRWRGGDDFTECSVCGLEFDYRKSLMPPCGAAARIAELELLISSLGRKTIVNHEPIYRIDAALR